MESGREIIQSLTARGLVAVYHSTGWDMGWALLHAKLN